MQVQRFRGTDRGAEAQRVQRRLVQVREAEVGAGAEVQMW